MKMKENLVEQKPVTKTDRKRVGTGPIQTSELSTKCTLTHADVTLPNII